MIRDYILNRFLKLFPWIIILGILSVYMYSSDYHGELLNKRFLRKTMTKLPVIKNCTVIVRNPLGRLGNILFEFASAYGVSLDHSCHLYIGPDFFKELGEFFEIDIPEIMTEIELNRTKNIKHIYNHCTYFPDLFQSNKSEAIELIGYWQAQTHFVNHTTEIRYQLKFKENILNRTNDFIITNINRSISNVVGIHIRRGDFVGKRIISTDKFIFDSMNYFIQKYHSIYFIIVSDDKNYCRRVFGIRNDTFITPDLFNPGEDMALLTLCDHLIITVGTYGWWAGFLLNNRTGEIIVDAKPDHSPIDVDCNGSVFFPYWFSFLNNTK